MDLTPAAQKLWDVLPTDIQRMLLNNVWWCCAAPAPPDTVISGVWRAAHDFFHGVPIRSRKCERFHWTPSSGTKQVSETSTRP
jgi:hypothetical protein